MVNATRSMSLAVHLGDMLVLSPAYKLTVLLLSIDNITLTAGNVCETLYVAACLAKRILALSEERRSLSHSLIPSCWTVD